MKGKLHKSMNYGWMVQDGLDSFYPLYPYDLFTNSIERVEGKEVDFILVYSWNEQEEKLTEVAIISANITDVHFKQETLYTTHQVREIIRKSQIRDEFGIFVYPNEDELLNLKLK